MNYLNTASKRYNFVNGCLLLTVFFIPISPTLKSIFLILSVIGIILTKHTLSEIKQLASSQWCKSIFIFFLIVLLEVIWSEAPLATRLIILEKYAKLLCLPILTLGFRTPMMRQLSLYVFLMAMVVTCFISILKAHGLIVFHGPDPGEVFHNHIVTGFMTAFAAYLSGLFIIQQSGIKRILFFSLFLFFSYQLLFINTGRTGYILYLALMCLLLINHCSWKLALTAILLFSVCFGFIGYQSPVVSKGLLQIKQDVDEFTHGHKSSSVGYRIMFHQYAKSLFLSSPWIGHGAGSFSNSFERDNPVPSWTSSRLLDPHSQYWLVAAEFGAVGLVLLLAVFFNLFSASLKMKDMKPVMQGLLLAFLLGNLTDSLLLYSVVGYLFVILCAVCLSETSALFVKGQHQQKQTFINTLHTEIVRKFRRFWVRTLR